METSIKDDEMVASCCNLVEGFEEEATLTSEWQKLSKQLSSSISEETRNTESIVKPFRNSTFLWVESDLDYTNGKVSNKSQPILLHFRIWKSDRNTEQSPRVVFLIHGVGSSTVGWRHCVDALLEKFDMVVAIDLPGFGFSSRIVGLSHTRWNRAFWCVQLMREVSSSISVSDTQVLWTVLSHSMSCLFSPSLIWLVNQNEWADFSETYLVKDFKRNFKIDNLIMAAGTYFQSHLSELLSYSIVQSVTRAILKMVMGKKAMGFILKNSFNRPPTNEELLTYIIPLQLENSINCLVDILISYQADDQQFLMDKHLEILNQLTNWCHVIQIVSKLDNVHSMDEAMKLKSMLENQKDSKGFVFKQFDTTSHCLMETDIEIFNTFLITELVLQ